MLYPRLQWQYYLTPSVDVSGAPSVVVGTDERTYFAISVRGSVGSLNTSTTTHSIVVGCVDNAGLLEWVFQDPSFVSAGEDAQPVLALSADGTALYLAFVTTGAVPGATNGADTFSLCGNCGSSAAGREDIVVVRFDGIQSESPRVAWVTQDAYLNSCNRETAPRLFYDGYGDRLFVVYECTGATLCKVALGSPNIVVACLTTAGGTLSWAYQEELLNARGGQQRSPSLTVDASGGIYIAYTITAPVEGGAPLQGIQDVEVVKLTAAVEGCGMVIRRPWILSQTAIVNAPGALVVNTAPSIVCNPNTGDLFLSFTTTGVVPGGAKSAATQDIVLVSLTSDGALRWIQQGPVWNEVTYRYASIDHPVLALNCSQEVYVAAHALDPSGSDMLVQFRLDPVTGKSVWLYKESLGQVYRAYVPVADFTTPFASPDPFGIITAPQLTVCNGYVYVSFTDTSASTAWIFAERQQEPVADLTAFQYMTGVTICEDVPPDVLEVAAAAVATITLVTPTFAIFDAQGNPVDFGFPPASAPIQERIQAVMDFVHVFQQVYTILDENGNQVTVPEMPTLQEQADALAYYFAAFNATYAVFDENGNRLNM